MKSLMLAAWNGWFDRITDRLTVVSTKVTHAENRISLIISQNNKFQVNLCKGLKIGLLRFTFLTVINLPKNVVYIKP